MTTRIFPDQVPTDEIQRAWVAVERVAPALYAAVETKLKAAGLPGLDWYSVLWGLERGGGALRPRDLGKALFLERYNITRFLDRLEAEGLVERKECKEDGRGQIAVLTEAGYAMRKKMWAVYAPAMKEVFAPLTDEEAVMLTSLLNKLG